MHYYIIYSHYEKIFPHQHLEFKNLRKNGRKNRHITTKRDAFRGDAIFGILGSSPIHQKVCFSTLIFDFNFQPCSTQTGRWLALGPKGSLRGGRQGRSSKRSVPYGPPCGCLTSCDLVSFYSASFQPEKKTPQNEHFPGFPTCLACSTFDAA